MTIRITEGAWPGTIGYMVLTARQLVWDYEEQCKN
jgi:hypothetical protein